MRRFGVGGYASGPMMLLAALHRIPTVVFEPNVEPGFTNRVLARHGHARRRGPCRRRPRDSARKAVVTGCPIRTEFFAIPPKEHRAPFTLLITGGSRGALPINRAVIDSLDRLAAQKKSAFHRASDRRTRL